MSAWRSKLLSHSAAQQYGVASFRGFGAFDIVAVGGCGIGRLLRLGRLFGRAKVSGTVVTAHLDIIVLGKRRDHCSATRDLANTTKNNFRAPVVEFDKAVDFDGASRETANIAD